MLTSSKLVEALDVTKEPERIRDRYGRGSPKHLGDGAPHVERPAPDGPPAGRGRVPRASRSPTASGTRTAATSATCKQHLPLFDQGISALVEDIYARGLDQDVTVVRVGRVRPDAEDQQGRRPRPLGAGELGAAGRRRDEDGQVIGSDRQRRAARRRTTRCHYPTCWRRCTSNLGIDPHAMVYDVSNRPNPILPSTYSPIDKVY